jgi:hypothetical protein
VIFPLRGIYSGNRFTVNPYRYQENKKTIGSNRGAPQKGLKKEVVEMKELNVISELFPQHLLDRLRENAIEEAIEEERREYARELSFEEVKEW